MNKLRLGLPKGSLQESTFSVFRKAGIGLYAGSRSYFPVCDDDELDVMLIRSQEIPRYVQDGLLDAGLTGYDWIRECRANVKEVTELIYAKSGYRPIKWVLAPSVRRACMPPPFALLHFIFPVFLSTLNMLGASTGRKNISSSIRRGRWLNQNIGLCG